MSRFSQLALAGLALTLMGVPADAQRRGIMRTARGNVPVAVPAGAQVVRVSPVRFRSGDFIEQVGNNPVSHMTVGTYPVPGAGFDYTHYAAVNRNLATRALIDPKTQHQMAQALRAHPVPIVPIAVPTYVNNVQVVVVMQPPVVILSEDEFRGADESLSQRERRRWAEEMDSIERGARMRELERARLEEEKAAAARPVAPPREVGDLVFIRRDGGVVFATAYVVRGERIVYITREGHRQSLALSQLDLEATREMNESLGTTLRL